jgi:beta-lactamase class D
LYALGFVLEWSLSSPLRSPEPPLWVKHKIGISPQNQEKMLEMLHRFHNHQPAERTVSIF